MGILNFYKGFGLFALGILSLTTSFGQNVGINSTGAVPNAASMLDIEANGKGLLIPRVTLAQRTVAGQAGGLLDGSGLLAVAAQGLLVYQTDGVQGFYYNTSTTTTPNWVSMSGDSGLGWALAGNTGTTAGTDYVGTTDATDFVFKTAGTEYMRLNGVADGFVGFLGIGTTTPQQMLQVADDITIGGTNDGNSENMKIIGQSDAWSIGVQNEATVGASDFFIGLSDDIEDGIFHIQNDGNIGIGLTAPTSQLMVNSSTGEDAFRVQVNNITKMWVLSNGGTALGAFQATVPTNGLYVNGLTGLGTNVPNDQLDVVGNAQVSGYLRVGNPTEPSGVNINDVIFYHVDYGTDEYWNYVLQVCTNADGPLWSIGATFVMFDNTGTTEHFRALHSPYIWLPGIVNTVSLRAEIKHECTLENNFDGVYLAWDPENDGTYAKMTSWFSNGYTAGIDGCDQSCLQPNTTAWTSSSFAGIVTSVTNTLAGYSHSSWIRIRLEGMEDNTNATGDYKAYNMWLKGNGVSFGGSGYEDGNIHAEGHVFAQSNAQIGDIAEYFPVQGTTTPGDLITM
ncbi:MAG: hypothetical protein JKY42_05275, partial [Flavobacteriales bacterium]|nr:hypothetical protein [Flavobacteriales bacterium]